MYNLEVQTINAIAGTTTVPVFTLASAGALNVSGVTTTAIAAANLPLTATGAAVAQTLALTGFTLNGSALNDVITGSALPDIILAGNGVNDVTGGLGADVMTGGTGVDTFRFVAGDNGSATAAAADRVNAFTTGADIVRGMGVAGATAGEFTTATGITVDAYAAALAAANVVFAAANAQSYFMTSFGTNGVDAQGVLFLNLDNNAVADGAILIGVANQTATVLLASQLLAVGDILG